MGGRGSGPQSGAARAAQQAAQDLKMQLQPAAFTKEEHARLRQVSNRIARDVREIAQLDAEAASPFASANDVLVRLLPYHALYEDPRPPAVTEDESASQHPTSSSQVSERKCRERVRDAQKRYRGFLEKFKRVAKRQQGLNMTIFRPEEALQIEKFVNESVKRKAAPQPAPTPSSYPNSNSFSNQNPSNIPNLVPNPSAFAHQPTHTPF
mmetsp:Transcript_45599/g.87200  ORF Transcript_45599/g.87200 Transcript_45599/m.87200 type:complete len:209 (+) Transcript_45599:222-848(+)|eukprot:CAMPEP_0114253240 /NCGR_PEP_ID=MMETSP0058-20121206/16280_1 /TAXON_ID=36894 /ORGANISM="Pyramimonas parkeae, CCMP726" /LENGTH=208 /DNA_ID=CAMNT_0001367259 /DNA_START=174 /DNA_END=800 /DNA_ORIENTATION=+